MIPLEDVVAARQRIAPFVKRTPLFRSRTLSERFGTNVYIKAELLQVTGSFKPRGAFNQLMALSDEQRSHGVVGISGGNFAQGMAHAASTLEVDCVIVMPESTPANYVEATKGYGASVVLEPDIASSFEKYEELAEQGRTAVHPFDNPAMQAGNGSLGLEVVEDVPDVTDVFISVGGGGFIAGVASAILGLQPGVRIWAVETEGADVLARSLAAGRPVEMNPTSLAKTLGSPFLAPAAFELATAHFHRSIVVSDAEAYHALRFILERTKLLPELAASCTLAAMEKHADAFALEAHVVLVLCGGNVSVDDLAAYREAFG